MAQERRPTYPLELPLITLKKLLSATVGMVDVNDAIKTIQRERVPLVEAPLRRTKKQPNIRISKACYNGCIHIKQRVQKIKTVNLG